MNLSNITIPTKLWFRLSDLVQDLGNHHPSFAGTDRGRDLDVLGQAIKYGVPPTPDGVVGATEERLLSAAATVVERYGRGRAGLSVVEQCIETVEHLLGVWSPELES
jgi:hypothetical protein